MFCLLVGITYLVLDLLICSVHLQEEEIKIGFSSNILKLLIYTENNLSN